MPIYHSIREDHAIVISVDVGVTLDNEFIAAYKKLYDNPDFSTEYRKLVDLRIAESDSRSTSALRTIADLVKNQYVGVENAPRTAVVAPIDISFGLARMYAAFSDLVPGEILVVRDPKEAVKWLEVPFPVLKAAEKDAHNKAKNTKNIG